MKKKEVLSVSSLNTKGKKLLEDNFFSIWVEGEISNFISHTSGHWYFSLKDNKAQIRCAMFKFSNYMLKKIPENGLLVHVRAKVTLYEPRGEYQLICDKLEAAGDGKLLRDFELLKNKLVSEGLFDEQNKKPLPKFPTRVGVITSETGAVLQDIRHVLQRRAPHLEVFVYPSQVQGENAVKQLINRLTQAQYDNHCDILILARGGGSLEDLNAFNNEELARVIAACKLPIVSAVGHETDFSISDFVADLRAPTPSAAAEIVSPDINQWLNFLSQTQHKLYQLMLQIIKNNQYQLGNLNHKLVHPSNKLDTMKQQLDNLQLALEKAMQQYLHEKKQQLALLQVNRSANKIENHLDILQQKLSNYQHLLGLATLQQIKKKKQQLSHTVNQLNLLSPLSTMSRGYALVSKHNIDDKRQLITSIDSIHIDDTLNVQLSNGALLTKVIAINNSKVSPVAKISK